MPAAGDESTRRSVVPHAAGRSLWLTAAWTGIGTAVVCAVVAIIAVAVLWLPTAASSGHSTSAIRAGLLTFLAALHGGITVDGTSAAFLPLGLTIIVGCIAWRAGGALADTAHELGETDPVRIAAAGLAQTACFASACLVGVPLATLGTSSAPLLGVGLAAVLLFALAAGAALVRAAAPVRTWVCGRIPDSVRLVLRPAAAAVLIYLAAGAALVAGSLIMHHGQAEALSSTVGGGWSGVPVLLLGILAAPNAVVAGAAYLSGPGFAVGAGTTASLFSTTHGTLPAFPVLAAMPDGSGSPVAAWVLGVAVVLGAGVAVTRLTQPFSPVRVRLRGCAGAALAAGAVMFLLAWQAGGGIGEGRLRTVGASPWQLGAAITLEIVVVSGAALALTAAWRRWGAQRWAERDAGGAGVVWQRLRLAVSAPPTDQDDPTTTQEDESANTEGGDPVNTQDSEETGRLAG